MNENDAQKHCGNCSKVTPHVRLYSQGVHYWSCLACDNEQNDTDCLSGADGCPNG